MPYGTFPSGADFGYQQVRNTPIQVIEAGVYYFGTLTTGRPHTISQAPDAEMIAKAKAKYAALLADKKPIGFNW